MKKNTPLFLIIVLVDILILPRVLFCQYSIQSGVFANGGCIVTDSSDVILGGVIGQQLTGLSANYSYQIQSGFWSQPIGFFVSIKNPFAIEAPATFVLFQNYPNPFNPTTTIKYGLPKPAWVTIELYTILGQKITSLFNGKKPAGYHYLTVTATNLASGMYIYTIRAEDYYRIKKMVVLK